MRACKEKQVIIEALYYYMTHAKADEQIDSIRRFSSNISVSSDTDPDKRATMFEDLIESAVKSLYEEEYNGCG